MANVQMHPEVRDALRGGRALVALESAVVTSGMPRAAVDGLEVDSPQWRSDLAVNLEVALLMDRAVREAGATPAMIAVIDGVLRIGLDANDIERLALDERAGKASVSNLAACCAAGETAGTTVSATLCACDLAGLRVFATGGIGGVHRHSPSLEGGGQGVGDESNVDDHSTHPPAPSLKGRGSYSPPDISADLLQLARTPTLVVSAGAKSILNLPATLEALETLGVPVLGYQTNHFPQFYSAGDPRLAVPNRVDSIKDVAAICRCHWRDLRIRGGILLANPVPQKYALDAAEVERLVESAEALAAAKSISGAARTPFLLDEIARASAGRTLRANIALLEANARLAAHVAVELAA